MADSPITDRAGLEAAIDDLRKEIGDRASKSPESQGFWKQFLVQLDLKAWMAKGRTPTDEELDMIDVGWLAVRELEDGDPQTEELKKKLTRLQDFVMKWEV